MMRTLVYLSCILAVMGLAFWAYRENYRTQAALDDMRGVQREIATLREELGVLRAEWAYLNRPDRLRELVSLNFDKLRLVPVDSGQFIEAGQIDYARPPAPPEPPEAGEPPEDGEDPDPADSDTADADPAAPAISAPATADPNTTTEEQLP